MCSWEVCGKVLINKNSLTSNTRIHTGENHYSCELYGITFSIYYNSAKHTSIHVYQGKLCSWEVCWKVFIDKNSLTSHTRIHTGENPYSCELYGITFSIYYNSANHASMHVYQGKSCSWEVCWKVFINKNSLISHTRIHTGENPHSCKLYGITFSIYYNSANHTRINPGIIVFLRSLWESIYR